MRLLLDTHIALWAVVDDPKLPPKAVELIADPANEVFVSVASLWEIAIKHALARGEPNDMLVSAQEALRYFAAPAIWCWTSNPRTAWRSRDCLRCMPIRSIASLSPSH